MKNMFKNIRMVLILLIIILFAFLAYLSTNVYASPEGSFTMTSLPENSASININKGGNLRPDTWWEIAENPNELLTVYCVYRGAHLRDFPLNYTRQANIRDIKGLYMAATSTSLKDEIDWEDIAKDEFETAKKMKELMWIIDSIVADTVEGISGDTMKFQKDMFFSQYIAYVDENSELLKKLDKSYVNGNSELMKELNKLSTKDLKMLNQAALWVYSHSTSR